jgi:hypothetical protein
MNHEAGKNSATLAQMNRPSTTLNLRLMMVLFAFEPTLNVGISNTTKNMLWLNLARDIRIRRLYRGIRWRKRFNIEPSVAPAK